MDDAKVPKEGEINAESTNLSENELSQVAGGRPTTKAPQQYLTVKMTDVTISGVQTSGS